MSTNYPDPESADWISQAEAARLHGVSRQAIHKLVQGGRLRTKAIGGRSLINRADLDAFRPLAAGRPRAEENRELERIKRILLDQSADFRREIFEFLREELVLHPYEQELGASAEVVLDALQRASDLTKRMFRGILAESAFEHYVVKSLTGWANVHSSGNTPYDFLLEDAIGRARVQVKLQRSEKHRPLAMVETQKTRGGKRGGKKTRPYRFDDFDVLAVSLQPSTHQWNNFVFTLTRWLIPHVEDPTWLATYQPIILEGNSVWTNNFPECIEWLRSDRQALLAWPKE